VSGERLNPLTRRGAASNVRLGAGFEQLFHAAVAPLVDVCLARVHPETKMIPDGRGGRKLIYVRKNGVDFLGTAHGAAVALELKRLPNAASLRGTKNDSTQDEARFLLGFVKAGGRGGFLVEDPDRDRLYVITALEAFERIATGGGALLRQPDGTPATACWELAGAPAIPVAAIRYALRAIASGTYAGVTR
jgi:hypothetical protein